MDTLGQNIKKLRKNENITQKQLAEAIKASREALGIAVNAGSLTREYMSDYCRCY